MNSNILVSEDIAIAHLKVATAEDALRSIAEQAIAAGFVHESFTEALLKREEEYPTGLPTEIPVALPHTDPVHVKRAGLGIITLAEPVAFGEMGGDGSSTVAAQAVILILVDDPSQQVALLSQLVGLIQEPGWFETVSAAQDGKELAQAFSRLLA